ncbi:hypothetical protein QJS10_CPB11g01310 [Acorus calamus]|uniref:DUF4220 domain-containing protein n=1 Tax=Acorus calamus TaxID=4465 RepID=A0AAV9DYL1_ACOCL|nr:hypothetical protein QJS10_CPB11g01310 [Acorus calamus]
MRGWRWGLVIWLAYLAADYVATTALGVLSTSTAIGGGGSNSKVMTPPSSSSSSDGLQNGPTELVALWSSFLLLHLGGPDTITAYALEDNELWKRHLLGLITQVGLALYVIIKSSIVKSGRWNQLLVPTVLMFLVGVLKFGERTWTLRYGSQDKFREFMENIEEETEYDVEAVNNTNHHTTSTTTEVESEADVEAANKTTCNTTSTIDKDIEVESEADVHKWEILLCKAHNFYHTFRRLIVDQMLTRNDRNKSKPFFMKLEAKQAFQVIEIELSLIYEALYTKAPLVYTVPGVCFRALAFTFITISFFFFQFITDKSRYNDIDLAITYVLLVGALVLELYANILHIFSDQAFLWLKQSRKFNNKRWLLRLFSNKEKRYWSHNMAQYNRHYVPYNLKEKIIQWIDLTEEFYMTEDVPITDELKKFVFDELKRKLMEEEEKDKKKAVAKADLPSSSTYEDLKRLSECRGERVLQHYKFFDKLGWSVVDIEFDKSICILYTVTRKLLYHDEGEISETLQESRLISKTLSDYMMYLLLFRTPMITAGISKPYKALFGSAAGESLKSISKVMFKLTKEDENSLAFFELKLETLHCEFGKMERTEVWKIVSAVWTEMLCYAACHCRGYNHAQRLSKGGELLTFVWFLMAHLGTGQHYREEAGEPRLNLDPRSLSISQL